jgi:hypothetical protein
MKLEQPNVKCLRTVYDLETRQNGEHIPLSNVGFQTLQDARDMAARRARASGLPVIELTWRQDFKSETRDGVFLCEIRQDVAIPGYPRVFI